MIVLDTSLLVSHFNDRDTNHDPATGVMERIRAGEWTRVLVPDLVLAELLNVLEARTDQERAYEVGSSIVESAEITLVPCIRHLGDAMDVFRDKKRRALSFTDCAIVAITRNLGAGHIGTFDRAFRNMEGFQVVP